MCNRFHFTYCYSKFILHGSVVRDYICKEIDEEESRSLQQSFVNLLLASQESWQEMIGDRIPRGKELDWYMYALNKIVSGLEVCLH